MPLSWDELEQIRGHQPWRIPIPPTCPTCSYNLTGLPDNRCPECGKVFDIKYVRRRAGRVWSAVNALRHADRDTRFALKIIAAAWVLLVPVAIFRASWGSMIFRVFAASLAILGLVLAGQVFNIRRVPPWARVYVPGSPNKVLMGAVAVLLALLLLALVFIL